MNSASSRYESARLPYMCNPRSPDDPSLRYALGKVGLDSDSHVLPEHCSDGLLSRISLQIAQRTLHHHKWRAVSVQPQHLLFRQGLPVRHHNSPQSDRALMICVARFLGM